MGVRLPEVFIDAKQMIEDVLEADMKVSIRRYGALYSNLGDVVHYHIEDKEDEEDYATFDMVLTYKLRELSKNDEFIEVEKTQNLRVLNSNADSMWTYSMINKIWDGDYPSTVVLDTDTGVVYLLTLRTAGIELAYFGKLDDIQFETVKYDLNDREPYKIKIDEDAMFDYIDGAEGVNHLKRNIYVELNAGMPIRVYNRGVERKNAK